jgi:peptidoglycan L-alanyl-D-glutamate endopeptidase CwlK
MAFKLTPSDRDKLSNLHPDLVRVVEHAARISPVKFWVIEGRRTLSRQKQLVAKGASKTMNSRHLTGHAVDIIPLVDINQDGKVSSNEMWAWPSYFKLAPVIKQAARLEKVRLEWGGDWKSFKDGPHWQLPWASHPIEKDWPPAEYSEAPPMTDETEQSAAGKEVAAIGTAGATGAVSVGTEPIGDVVDAVSGQQYELSSGDIVRSVIALAIVGVTIWLMWPRIKTALRR